MLHDMMDPEWLSEANAAVDAMQQTAMSVTPGKVHRAFAARSIDNPFCG